jgi:hypothetical protein
MSRFCFFHSKNNSFLTFNFLYSNLPFVLLGFCYFLVVFERNSLHFHFNHSDVRIKQNVLFCYQNEMKMRPQKQIGFMHVDITSNGDVFYQRLSSFVLFCNEKLRQCFISFFYEKKQNEASFA